MTTTTFDTPAGSRAGPVPRWYWVAAGLGLLWNLYGVFQLYGTVTATPTKLMEMGMNEAQARLYAGLPIWMNAVFTLGVLGGTAGCALLLARRRLAVPVFAASLAGYVALYVGDILYGVFAAIGASQVVILTFVVAVAVALLAMARHFQTTSVIR